MTKHNHTAATQKERSYGKIAVAGLLTLSVGFLAAAGVYAGLSGVATGSEAVSVGYPEPDPQSRRRRRVQQLRRQDGAGRHRQRLRQPEQHRHPGLGGGHDPVGGRLPVQRPDQRHGRGRGPHGDGHPVLGAWTLATGSCTGTSTTLSCHQADQHHDTAGTAVACPTCRPWSGHRSGGPRPGEPGAGGQRDHDQRRRSGPTIQGLSTTLTYTFTEQQRQASPPTSRRDLQ